MLHFSSFYLALGPAPLSRAIQATGIFRDTYSPPRQCHHCVIMLSLLCSMYSISDKKMGPSGIHQSSKLHLKSLFFQLVGKPLLVCFHLHTRATPTPHVPLPDPTRPGAPNRWTRMATTWRTYHQMAGTKTDKPAAQWSWQTAHHITEVSVPSHFLFCYFVSFLQHSPPLLIIPSLLF